MLCPSYQMENEQVVKTIPTIRKINSISDVFLNILKRYKLWTQYPRQLKKKINADLLIHSFLQYCTQNNRRLEKSVRSTNTQI